MKAQSETINLLRFPLALLVILIHTNSYYSSWHADVELLSVEGVCFLLGHILRLFACIAVPTYFMISGFLFFGNFKEFTWNGYFTKIKKRIKSLVIPYIIWNVIVWLAFLLKNVHAVYDDCATWNDVLTYLSNTNIRFLWDFAYLGENKYPWLCWTTYDTAPINIPLWFLRDLIVVTVCSPLIFWAIRTFKIYSIILLCLAHIFQIRFTCSGFSITAFFFFSLGAYFAITGRNIIDFCQKYRKVILLAMCCSMLLFITQWIPNGYKIIVKNIFCIPAMFFAFWVAQYFVTNKGVKANPWLVSSCFFIYASHTAALPEAPVLVVYDSVYNNLFRLCHSHALVHFVSYLIAPCITAAILFIIYYLLAKFFPKIEMFVCGGRGVR